MKPDEIDVLDRTFYVLYTGVSLSRGPSPTGPLLVYRFTLSAHGRLSGFAPVSGASIPVPQSAIIDPVAVSPDGTRLAVATPLQQIVLVDLRTGQRTIWRGGLDGHGPLWGITSLNWTADSKSLVYLAAWCVGVTICPEHPAAQVRRLNANGPGGRLTDPADSRLDLHRQGAHPPADAGARLPITW